MPSGILEFCYSPICCIHSKTGFVLVKRAAAAASRQWRLAFAFEGWSYELELEWKRWKSSSTTGKRIWNVWSDVIDWWSGVTSSRLCSYFNQPAMEDCEVEDWEQRWFETKRSLHNAKVPYFLRTISERHIRRPTLSNDVRTFEMVINRQVWWMARPFLTFLHDDLKIKLTFLGSICILDFFSFFSAFF